MARGLSQKARWAEFIRIVQPIRGGLVAEIITGRRDETPGEMIRATLLAIAGAPPLGSRTVLWTDRGAFQISREVELPMD